MGRYHSQNSTVIFEDAVGNTITVGPGEGNFQVGEINESNKEVVQKFDRGSHDGWVETIDLTQAWSITIDMRNEAQTSEAAARIQDWLRRTGRFASDGAVPLQSVSPDTWAFKVKWIMNDGVVASTATMPECPARYTGAEGVEGHTLAISGMNALAPVWT